MFVRLLFVFDLLFNLFRIALWPSVGNELSLWLFTCAVFMLVPFPVWCLGQYVEFDCIVFFLKVLNTGKPGHSLGNRIPNCLWILLKNMHGAGPRKRTWRLIIYLNRSTWL